MKNAEVVIVGAGIIGCSIAYFLAKKGQRDIIVLDKGGISSGVTAICPGGVRQQWGTEINCLMSKFSTDFYETINEELQPETTINFRQVGYLYLLHSELALTNYKKSVELQNQHGIPTIIVSPDEAAEIIPGINKEEFLAASYCPTDGFVDSASHVTQSFADAAKRLGVTFIEAEAYSISTEQDRVVAIETSKGRINCHAVVNAAGYDSPQLASSIGIELPITREKRRLLFTKPITERIIEPLLVSFEKGFASKQLVDGTIYMSYLRGDIDFISSPEEFEAKALEVGASILPLIKELEIVRYIDGIYDSTPDHQAILGDIKQVSGYFNAIGMSGHGFMMAPAIGQVLAELILGEKPFMDISPLHFNRFNAKKLIPEPRVV